MSQRPRRVPVLVVPVGVLRGVVLLVIGLGLVVAVVASGVLERAASGTTVADPAAVLAQHEAAVRDIERGYEQSTDQVRKARGLKLAISTQRADAVANQALADLATLRHSALVSLAQLSGVAADAEAYARSTEQALDAKRGQPGSSAAPVLLAPRLYAIVTRFDQLAGTITDKAITDLTQPPTPSASPTR